MAGRSIRILLNGEPCEIRGVPPATTVLDWLRTEKALTGTKEGCAEGDCGACTVALGIPDGGAMRYEAANSCLLAVPQLDGKALITVEGLANGGLHPIQRAMVEADASQCGFCTPGIVMALFAFQQSGEEPGIEAIHDALAGNLCRCTGYRPIVDAALEACAGTPSDAFAERHAATVECLAALDDGEDLFVGDEATGFFAAPATVDALARLYAHHPEATLVAGATDVGLWITKQMRALPKIIHLGRVAGLAEMRETEQGFYFGACVTHAQAEAAMAAIDPDLVELFRRFGGKQVRAVGTLGGNIANGSPIGDSMPALIALGTTLHLRRGEATRSMPLEDFFIDYGKQDRAAGEFVTGIDVPRLQSGEAFRCYKISKRFDQDISALLGAFRFTLEGRRVTHARVAFGGMAATPKRAAAAEAALKGLPLADAQGWDAACDALASDFQPIDDMRASARYRLATAQALLRKALHEAGGEASAATRLVGLRPGEAERAA